MRFLNDTPLQSRSPVRDDVAYILPMVTFLAFTQIGVWWPGLYAATYIAKTIVVAAMLYVLRGAYTKISWSYWWLGAIVGVIGVAQWVGMQLWLQQHVEFFRPDPASPPFDPTHAFASAGASYAFIGLRWIAGASLVVPVMEELFWRDFLWRQTIAPSNFKLAKIGEWSAAAFFSVAGVFAVVHGNWWLTSIVWALLIGGLLAYTRSLGACIVAHAVTNLLLGAYVLWSRDWGFW
ncbi:hypothetical protein BH10PLA1_BH10PLA1_12220 [soil metagenome]